MSKIDITVNVPTRISLTEDQIFNSLEQLLDIKDYSLIDGKLYRYDRTSHNGYGYVHVPINTQSNQAIFEKVEAFVKLKELRE